MVKVLLADDHQLVREGLKQILAETSDIKVVDEAENGRAVLEKVRQTDFDLILLDISLPDRNGLDVLRQVREEGLETPILILSRHPESQYAIRALKLGAAGYLTKDSAPEELSLAIRKVSAGETYITRSLADRLVHLLGGRSSAQSHELLSNREFEIMGYIAKGQSGAEIAAALSLSINTVNTHRARILKKMGLKNNAELIRYAIRNDLIE
ncbi:MAG: response regulator transcription factor [Candidatus Neomarinimicrobiota bacterium]